MTIPEAMTNSNSLSEAWAKRAIDVKAKGEQALAAAASVEDETGHIAYLGRFLRDALEVVSGFLRLEDTRAEVQNPTWRPLHRQEDRIYFCNDRGEVASLQASVAAALARGVNLAGETRVKGGVVEIATEDGRQDTAPLSLIRALTPKRWPSGATGMEVQE